MTRFPAAARAGLVTFAATLGVYLATMAPGLPPGHDSAELTAGAAVLGIPHPPGYPLYTMVGHLFTMLPGMDPAWGMNLFSVLAGALAAGLAGAAFTVLVRSDLAGTGAALAFAFARTPWRMAVGAEVFSLHLVFVAALLLLAGLWREADVPGRRRCMTAAALVFGLGLAHHQTIVLLLPGLLAFGWLARGDRPVGLTPLVLPALAVGLSPYLYLPLRAAQGPPLNWGDPDTPSRLVWMVLRQGYGGLKLSTASGTQPAAAVHLEACLRSLAFLQFPFVGVLLGVAGAISATVRRAAEGALLGALWLFAGPAWALIGAQPEGEGFLDMMERFYAASDLGFAGLVAVALAQAAPRWPRATRVLVVLLPALALAVNLHACSERGQYHVPDSLAAMVEPLPAGAVVVAGSDLTAGALLYARHVGERPLAVLPVGLVGSDWFQAQMPPDQAEAARAGGPPALLLHLRATGVPVFLDHVPQGVPGFFVPEGLLFRYLAPGEPLPTRDEAARRSLALLDRPRRGEWRVAADRPFWTRHLVRTWAWAYRSAGEGLLGADPSQAALAFETALAMEPDVARDLALLGQARLSQGRLDEAGDLFRRALAADPEEPAALEGAARLRGGR